MPPEKDPFASLLQTMKVDLVKPKTDTATSETKSKNPFDAIILGVEKVPTPKDGTWPPPLPKHERPPSDWEADFSTVKLDENGVLLPAKAPSASTAPHAPVEVIDLEALPPAKPPTPPPAPSMKSKKGIATSSTSESNEFCRRSSLPSVKPTNSAESSEFTRRSSLPTINPRKSMTYEQIREIEMKTQARKFHVRFMSQYVPYNQPVFIRNFATKLQLHCILKTRLQDLGTRTDLVKLASTENFLFNSLQNKVPQLWILTEEGYIEWCANRELVLAATDLRHSAPVTIRKKTAEFVDNNGNRKKYYDRWKLKLTEELPGKKYARTKYKYIVAEDNEDLVLTTAKSASCATERWNLYLAENKKHKKQKWALATAHVKLEYIDFAQ